MKVVSNFVSTLDGSNATCEIGTVKLDEYMDTSALSNSKLLPESNLSGIDPDQTSDSTSLSLYFDRYGFGVIEKF